MDAETRPRDHNLAVQRAVRFAVRFALQAGAAWRSTLPNVRSWAAQMAAPGPTAVSDDRQLPAEERPFTACDKLTRQAVNIVPLMKNPR